MGYRDGFCVVLRVVVQITGFVAGALSPAVLGGNSYTTSGNAVNGSPSGALLRKGDVAWHELQFVRIVLTEFVLFSSSLLFSLETALRTYVHCDPRRRRMCWRLSCL
jgi:hypothetical protein